MCGILLPQMVSMVGVGMIAEAPLDTTRTRIGWIDRMGIRAGGVAPHWIMMFNSRRCGSEPTREKIAAWPL